jgi:hypothetical protein
MCHPSSIWLRQKHASLATAYHVLERPRLVQKGTLDIISGFAYLKSLNALMTVRSDASHSALSAWKCLR